MAKFAINTLEFTKVREKLSQYAGTAMGQRLAMELMSSSRFEEVKLLRKKLRKRSVSSMKAGVFP